MLRPTVVSFLDLMLQEKSRTLRIEEIDLGDGSRWIGQKISDLDLGARYDLLVLALKTMDDAAAPLIFNPPPATALSQQTVIIMMGDVENLRRAREDARA